MLKEPTPIRLEHCPKAAVRDQDKAVLPEQTIAEVSARIKKFGPDIFSGWKATSRGRLGIPVYMAMCGPGARKIMPTRKQMGKGSSDAQARASALMEFVERFSFFSFWEDEQNFIKLRWSEARNRFQENLIPVSEIIRSVNDTISEEQAEKLLDLVEWRFYPATELASGRIVWLPLDWFRLLGEFNGSSAGNTTEEALLQGICELIERHVCAIADRDRPEFPTIDPGSCADPVLQELLTAFGKNGVNLILKDFSMGMPLPTVAAIAWDEKTFPEKSEIVFTAGTATSPVKAAIRAVTEVAQLGGDFCTGSCYEASGLPKFRSLADIAWLVAGKKAALADLPDASQPDMLDELRHIFSNLESRRIYAVDLAVPGLDIPAYYCISPGMQFRERDKNQSLGLFIGRMLSENADVAAAEAGLYAIAAAYPDAHFVPFHLGLLALRKGEPEAAAELFENAAEKQPEAESGSLAAFYAGHAWSEAGQWQRAIPWFELALKLNPELGEAANQLGVCQFKLSRHAEAEAAFDLALRIDRGMAIALANRGIARKFQGKAGQALEDLENALALDSSLEFAATHLSELKEQQ